MIKAEFNDADLQAGLARLLGGLEDASPAMNRIGEALVASSKDRVVKGISPDGTPFAPRSQATIDNYQRRGISYQGVLRQSGDMSSQIAHNYGSDFAEVGSNAIQAAMMQFGGTRLEFPNLWGDIPERNFIGLSDDDGQTIIEVVEDWLEGLE